MSYYVNKQICVLNLVVVGLELALYGKIARTTSPKKEEQRWYAKQQIEHILKSHSFLLYSGSRGISYDANLSWLYSLTDPEERYSLETTKRIFETLDVIVQDFNMKTAESSLSSIMVNLNDTDMVKILGIKYFSEINIDKATEENLVMMCRTLNEVMSEIKCRENTTLTPLWNI